MHIILTGKIILLAEEENCTLESLSLKDIQKIIPAADCKILESFKNTKLCF